METWRTFGLLALAGVVAGVAACTQQTTEDSSTGQAVEQAFDRNKILGGLQLACRKRPVDEEQLETIVAAVEQWAATRGEKEIRADEIGDRIMLLLRPIDAVAYVRFVSVYRSFTTVEEFSHLLREMEKASQIDPEGQRRLFEIDARGHIQLPAREAEGVEADLMDRFPGTEGEGA